MFYPKCKPGFHSFGCCICTPDCPDGWTDIGVSCKKPNYYGRGVGYPVTFGSVCLHLDYIMNHETTCGEKENFIGMLSETSLYEYY